MMWRPRNGSKIDEFWFRIMGFLDSYSRLSRWYKIHMECWQWQVRKCLDPVEVILKEKNFLFQLLLFQNHKLIFGQPKLNNVISNLFKNVSFLAHSPLGALRIVNYLIRNKITSENLFDSSYSTKKDQRKLMIRLVYGASGLRHPWNRSWRASLSAIIWISTFQNIILNCIHSYSMWNPLRSILSRSIFQNSKSCAKTIK